MRARELEEKWSEKYKRSINCSNPKGFSQRAHCAGRKKNEDVAEAINPDITNPAFKHQQQIGDYLYVARYWSKGLKITVYDGNKKIGRADLMYHSAPFDDFADPKTTPKRIWLESEITEVHPRYQRQGIMGTMYAYAKMLGNSVKPSELRSPDTKAAWASWRQSGDAKHLTSEGLAESSLTELAPLSGGDGDSGKDYLLQLAADLRDAMYVARNIELIKNVKKKIELAGGSVKIVWNQDGTFQTVMYHPIYFKQGYLIKLVGRGDQQLDEGRDNFKQVYNAIRDLLPIVMQELGIDQLPKIYIKKTLDNSGQPSFGSFNGTDITLAVSGRHPVDICRTLAHELTHYSQGLNNQLSHESGKTGSPEENEANSVAGIIMRKFSQKHPEYMKNESQ